MALGEYWVYNVGTDLWLTSCDSMEAMVTGKRGMHFYTLQQNKTSQCDFAHGIKMDTLYSSEIHEISGNRITPVHHKQVLKHFFQEYR